MTEPVNFGPPGPVGSVGASRVADIIREVRGGGASASRKNYLAELVLARLTGQPRVSFQSKAMKDGLEREAEAKRLYTFAYDKELTNTESIPHPSVAGAHASPDGLVGEDWLYEGKAPEAAQHLRTLRDGYVEPDYVTQMMWQMACTKRLGCDFVSYNPEFPPRMRLVVIPFRRDPKIIVSLEAAVRAFVREVDEAVAQLRRDFE